MSVLASIWVVAWPNAASNWGTGLPGQAWPPPSIDIEDRVGLAVLPGPSADLGRHPLLDRLRVAPVVLWPTSA